MKNIFLLFLFIMADLAVFAQDSIANGGFEQWNNYGAYASPTGWVTLNPYTAAIDSFTCIQDSATAHGGKYSVKLISKYIALAGQVVPGVISNGNLDVNSQTVSGGAVIHSRPTAITGWYQYATPGGPDTGAVRVEMLSANGSIGFGYFLFDQAITTWTPFTVNINYSSAGIPDTFQIVFLTTVANNSVPQTSLLLDDLSFSFLTDQCGITKTLTQTGGLCTADTLQVWGAAGASQITWNYNGAVDSVNRLIPPTYGTTVAGSASGNNTSLADSLLSGPVFTFIDAAGNLYVSDYYNNRVQKFAPGSNTGVTVAGDSAGNSGLAANLLSYPQGLFVDSSGNLYVADENNQRVQKWAPGATSGVTVAGGSAGNSGTSDSLLNYPIGIWMDAAQNLYIADEGNNRVQEWAPGATHGTTVAGSAGGTVGTADSLLDEPWSVFVDAANNIYVADRNNNRIQKWAPGASAGLTVAGDSTGNSGIGEGQLNNPEGVFVDPGGNLYIADAANNRIQKWVQGDTAGVTVAGSAAGISGISDSLFSLATWVWVDAQGSMYVSDFLNNRVQKWAGSINTNLVITAPGTYSTVITNYYGCVDTTNITIADTLPHPVISLSQHTLSTGAYYSYQWFLNGVAITDATNSTYTAGHNGVYQVLVTNLNGCSDTSASFSVTTLGINEINSPEISIYPNPTNGLIHVQCNNMGGSTTFELTDIIGQIVYTHNTNTSNITEQIDLSSYANGIYLLKITSADMVTITKPIVKN